jgi:hypothetical protein
MIAGHRACCLVSSLFLGASHLTGYQHGKETINRNIPAGLLGDHWMYPLFSVTATLGSRLLPTWCNF